MHYRDLLEKYINTNKEYYFLLDGRLPLSPTMWKRLSETTKVPLCYHMTDPKGLKVIQKIQGSKKQISAFTVGDSMIGYGVETDGGVLIELQGESTLRIEGDAWTALDRQGRRWWDLSEMSNDKIPKMDKIRKQLKKITQQVFDDFGYDTGVIGKENTAGRLTLAIEEHFSQKDKALFIKTAMEAVEKYIKKNVKISDLIEWSNKKMKDDYSEGFQNFNEIVLHNFKIKNIYGVVNRRAAADYLQDFTTDVELGYVSIKGWVTTDDVADIKNNRVKNVTPVGDV